MHYYTTTHTKWGKGTSSLNFDSTWTKAVYLLYWPIIRLPESTSKVPVEYGMDGWGGYLPIIKSLPTHIEVDFGCNKNVVFFSPLNLTYHG